MILERTPLNLNEVEEILKNISDNPKKEEIEAYLKKFLNTDSKKAKKIKEDLENLDLLKIKREHIVKIKDLKKEKTYIIHPVHLRKLKW